MSNPNSNPTQAAQAAAQAAIQAAKAKAPRTDDLKTDADATTLNEADEQLAKAWGFASKRPRISREAVIGLVAILALLGLFGFVVMRHIKNRTTVAETPDKVDPDVKQVSNNDPLGEQQPVAADLDELHSATTKPKAADRGLELEDESFDVGVGQSEPTTAKTGTKQPAMPRNLDDEFESFAEDTKTTNVRTQPKAAAAATDMPDFGDDAAPAADSSTTTSVDLNADETSSTSEPGLTKTTEPIRLKQPASASSSTELDFEEPVRIGAANRPEPKDDFKTIPQRAQRSVRTPQEDLFAERTAFDDPKPSTSPTTKLPASRGESASNGSARHPLLREGEYLVEEGDNFCLISKKVYGSEKYYLALAEHNRNRVADPCRMRPGLIIATPAKEVLEQQHSALIPKPKAASNAPGEKSHSAKKVSATALPSGLFYDAKGQPWYRVGKGDTLTGIAQAHLGRISRTTQIINLNRDRLPDPNDLRPGQELRLPNDASQVRLDETEKAVR